MKALQYNGNLEFVSNAPVRKFDDEALIEVLFAGICNTDLEIVNGYAGFRGIPGHEFVGRVVESPDRSFLGCRVVGEINVGCQNCRQCLAGDSRHCLKRTVLGIKNRDGAFAEYLTLPVRNLRILPDEISNEAAVFIEPLAAACQILDQTPIDSSMDVAVIGDGKLGQLIVRAMAHTHCNLTVIGKHMDKLDRLSGIVNQEIRFEQDNDYIQQVARLTDNKKFDVVIEASGSASGLPLAVQLAKPRGVIVLKSTFQGSTSIDLAPAVVNEIQIIGSRCGRFEPAINLLSRGQVDVFPLISDILTLGEGLEAFAKASTPDSLKVLLRMPAAN